MLLNVDHNLTAFEGRPSPDHAVWGDACRATAGLFRRLSLGLLLPLVTASLALES